VRAPGGGAAEKAVRMREACCGVAVHRKEKGGREKAEDELSS
jgi:hypothetical protein